jgi:hypothetical protein
MDDSINKNGVNKTDLYYLLFAYLALFTMIDSSPSAPSPNRNAKSQTL